MASAIPESGPLAAFLRYGCPGLGAGVALILFASPLPACLRVAKRGYLGDVNALPFAMMAANCAGWMFYGAFILDYFVYVANIPGLVGGFFYTLVCFRFSKAAAQNALTGIALAAALLFSLVGAADMAVADPAASKTIWGATAVAVLGVYYAAPLATLAKVVRERSSASLHWPLCLMNALNGTLWFAYGLALRDMFICAPNGVGALFNVICLGFCLAFPRREGGGAGAAADKAAAGGGEAAPAVPDLIGGNWGGLRLQSVRFPAAAPGVDALGSAGADPIDGAAAFAATDEDEARLRAARNGAAAGAAAPPAATGGGGSFLDLAQMRWRTGRSFLSPPGPRNNGGGRAGGLALAASGSGGSRVALVSAQSPDRAASSLPGAVDEEGGLGRPGSVRGRPIRESGER